MGLCVVCSMQAGGSYEHGWPLVLGAKEILILRDGLADFFDLSGKGLQQGLPNHQIFCLRREAKCPLLLLYRSGFR